MYFRQIPVTIAIIALCVLCFLAQLSDPDLSYFLGLNILFFDGFYHQLLSTMFAHGSLSHLAMNCCALLAFAYRIEPALGSLRFALLYIIGGILTSALSLSYLLFNPYVNLVGASGAICVLLGFMAYFIKHMRKGLFVGLIIMSFAPLMLGVSVAWYAHLFGFGVGFGLGFLKDRR